MTRASAVRLPKTVNPAADYQGEHEMKNIKVLGTGCAKPRQDRGLAVNDMDSTASEAFHARLKGTFSGILQWQQLDELWARVKPGPWFFYQVGEDVPDKSLSGDE